ncbi:MAG: hypothetical protein IKV94_04215 [Clostridia bacterium]|nr:hypothetical protein [Clostridia bacterium]
MDTLNQMELQDIRHTCGASSDLCKKIEYYKTITNNQKAIDIMTKICGTCDQLKQALSNML